MASPFFRQLFYTKSLDELVAETREEGHQLKRALGPLNLIALGIGAIIGAGIFATIGTAAAGDAHRPGAGPAYTYAYATLGELVAWIIGWDLILEYAIGNVGVAISWANYFHTWLETM